MILFNEGSEVLSPDIASSVEVDIEAKSYFVCAVLVWEYLIIGNVHGEAQAEVIVKYPLRHKAEGIGRAVHNSQPQLFP